ncbi:MAG: hypothetical protein AAF658_10520, partial [Myxococcota bacterium]
ESIRAAFQSAGVWQTGKLELAESAENRISTLAEMRPEAGEGWSAEQREAIGNLFGLVRNRVFGDLTNEAELAQANAATYSALSKLGLAETLRGASATSLQRLKLDVGGQEYRSMVAGVAGLAGWRSDRAVHELAEKEGLSITSVSWDDPSRIGTNSAWGSNIIDSSISVVTSDAYTGESQSHLMPIVRQPNMDDVTADIDMDKFMINVGNARGEPLRQISLKEALEKPWELMTDPDKWPLRAEGGAKVGVHAPGTDDQALVAAQSSLLPVSRDGGQATFVPSAYSYTSYNHEEHGPQPTILTLMVTREGTSMQILGDEAEARGFGGFGGGADSLHFNSGGERAPLTAERAKAVKAAGGEVDLSGGGQGNADQANRILLIQIPLIPEHKKEFGNMFALESVALSARGGGGDLDDAVIGHGPTEGPFNEEMGKGWKRDPDTPVRVTVQFAKTLEDPKSLDAKALAAIRGEIDAVYQNASRIGSLVVTSDGAAPNPPWMPSPPVIPFKD